MSKLQYSTGTKTGRNKRNLKRKKFKINIYVWCPQLLVQDFKLSSQYQRFYYLISVDFITFDRIFLQITKIVNTNLTVDPNYRFRTLADVTINSILTSSIIKTDNLFTIINICFTIHSSESISTEAFEWILSNQKCATILTEGLTRKSSYSSWDYCLNPTRHSGAANMTYIYKNTYWENIGFVQKAKLECGLLFGGGTKINEQTHKEGPCHVNECFTYCNKRQLFTIYLQYHWKPCVEKNKDLSFNDRSIHDQTFGVHSEHTL